MGKKGFKDAFGNAVKGFEHINRRNPTKTEKTETLAEQIARVEKIVEKEKEEKRIEKSKETDKIKWHKSSMNYSREY